MLQTKVDRVDEAQEVMREADARTVHHVHPADAFPEDRWREPRS